MSATKKREGAKHQDHSPYLGIDRKSTIGSEAGGFLRPRPPKRKGSHPESPRGRGPVRAKQVACDPVGGSPVGL